MFKMSAKKYHLIFANTALILAIINTLLVFILNSPSYLKLSLSRPKNPLILLIIPTIGAIITLTIIIGWMKNHYYKDLSSKSDFIKYGAIRGFLLPFTTLLAASVTTHLIAILYILNNITNLEVWAVIVRWAGFYLYLLPTMIFTPLLAVFVLIGAAAEEKLFFKSQPG